MIEALSSKLASRIKQAVPDHPTSEAVLKYSLGLVINASMIIILALFISLLTNKTSETVTILLSFALLRQLSGGIHLNTGMSCVVVSVTGATIISLISLNGQVTLISTGIALILMLLFAPTNIEKQSRIPKKYYPLLKVLSCIIVSLNFIIQSDVIALAFLVQGITLIIGRR